MDKTMQGAIYILTNPSFPQYVKIGYADDVEKRLKELNRSECIPFAFRLYAYYKVPNRLDDLKLHKMIDILNPNLRSIEEFNGKKRVREFYAMEAEDAYAILKAIAEINGLTENLVLVEQTEKQIEDEERAEADKTKNRRNLPRIDWMMEQGIVHEGDKICLINHPEAIAIMQKDGDVIYNGEKMSLSRYGCLVTGWVSIQCYAWTKLIDQDKTLAKLRQEKMMELGMFSE